jgi:cytoskeletal protein RodZ
MIQSVGYRLQQARISKQLSVEEASRATKIRPDKLIDLEEDNYANFPSMSYAKGFLLLYARFLDVDVRDYTDHLVTPNPVSTDDYEYLNAAASGPPPPPNRRPYHFSPKRERSILPVVVFGFLVVGIGLVIYLFMTFQRLGPLDDLADKKEGGSPAASPAISTLPPVAAATPVAVATPMPVRAAVPVLQAAAPALVAATPVPAREVQAYVPAVTAATPAPVAARPIATPVPAATFDPTREVRRAEPVFPTPAAQAAGSPGAAAADPSQTLGEIVPVATPEPMREVSIKPIRKTRVTIRRDVADSAPFFEDWLYPDAPPLKLSGHKFWIQVDDPSAVQITEDGRAIPAGNNQIRIE